MFLNGLDYEQKMAYLQLAKTLASADGFFSTNEESVMSQYRTEMCLPDAECDTDVDFAQAGAVIAQADKGIKRRVLFELAALAFVDSEFSAEEKNVILDLQRKFEVEENYIDKCEAQIRELTQLYKKIGKLIDG